MMAGCELDQRRRRGGLAACVALGVALAWPAMGQVPAELVEEALDQRIASLDVGPAPIKEALATLEQQTGLRFTAGEEVLALMPYGERTKIAITVRDLSVRAAVRQVLAGLGMTMRVVGDRVAIEPLPAVALLGRRLTIEEVTLLDKLAREPWASVAADPPVELRIDPALRPREALTEAMRQVRAEPALEALDSAAKALKWSWHPEGARIVLTTNEDEIRRRLDLPTDVHYQKWMLDAVLSDLGQRVGVTVMFEPGALQQVDYREKRVELTQKNVSPRQALERICGSTGLHYQVEPDGVRIYGPHDSPRVPAKPPGSRPAADDSPQAESEYPGPRDGDLRVEIEIRPGLRFDAVIPVRDLPLELRKECRRKLDELLRRLTSTEP